LTSKRYWCVGFATGGAVDRTGCAVEVADGDVLAIFLAGGDALADGDVLADAEAETAGEAEIAGESVNDRPGSCLECATGACAAGAWVPPWCRANPATAKAARSVPHTHAIVGGRQKRGRRIRDAAAGGVGGGNDG
jgi:hypothetical protein